MALTFREAEEVKHTVGHRLTSIMRTKGVTPYQLQERITELIATGKMPILPGNDHAIGVTAAAIYKYKKGETVPSRPKLEAVAAALEIPVTDLLPDADMLTDVRMARLARPNTSALIAVQRSKLGLNHGKLRVNISLDLPYAEAERCATVLRTMCDKMKISTTKE